MFLSVWLSGAVTVNAGWFSRCRWRYHLWREGVASCWTDSFFCRRYRGRWGCCRSSSRRGGRGRGLAWVLLVAHPAATEPITARAAQPARSYPQAADTIGAHDSRPVFLVERDDQIPRLRALFDSQPSPCAENLRITGRLDCRRCLFRNACFESWPSATAQTRRGAGLDHMGRPSPCTTFHRHRFNDI